MVVIILNLHTWFISPQLHVIFDDIFTTVAFAHKEEVVPQTWTNMITNPNDCLNVSLDKETNPTLANNWISHKEVQEQEVVPRQWIDKQHSLCQDNTSRQDWPYSTTMNQLSQSLPSASEGDSKLEIPFAP